MTTIKTLEEPIATCRTAGVVNGGICGAIKCSSDECGSPDHAKCSYSTSYVKPDVFGEWIKCSDRLPDRAGNYLAYINNPHLPHFGSWREVVLYHAGGAWSCGHATVTHWQPLPPAPTGEG